MAQQDDIRNAIRRRQKLQQRFYGELIERVSQERYPSIAQMNLIEQGASREQLDVYLDALLDKVARERHPSLSMLKRIENALG
jgi:hypothetical protein